MGRYVSYQIRSEKHLLCVLCTSVLPQWLPGVVIVELFEPGKNAAAGAVQWEQLECQRGAGGCWLLGIYSILVSRLYKLLSVIISMENGCDSVKGMNYRRFNLITILTKKDE